MDAEGLNILHPKIQRFSLRQIRFLGSKLFNLKDGKLQTVHSCAEMTALNIVLMKKIFFFKYFFIKTFLSLVILCMEKFFGLKLTEL